MTTHSSVLAWIIPGTEEPGGLPSVGRTESDRSEATQQQQQVVFKIDCNHFPQFKCYLFLSLRLVLAVRKLLRLMRLLLLRYFVFGGFFVILRAKPRPCCDLLQNLFCLYFPQEFQSIDRSIQFFNRFGVSLLHEVRERRSFIHCSGKEPPRCPLLWLLTADIASINVGEFLFPRNLSTVYCLQSF